MEMLQLISQQVQPTITVTILLGVLAAWLYKYNQVPKNFPPGARPWPLLGNLAILGQDPQQLHKVMAWLAEQYGPVVGLYLGNYPAVIISGVEQVKEALVKKSDAFSNRPTYLHMATRLLSKKGRHVGIVWNNGTDWMESRRFAMTAMRKMGLGKESIEQRIQEEAAVMCEEVAKHDGKQYDIDLLLQQATSNVTCSICFGKRYEYDNEEFQELMHMLRVNFSSPLFTSPLNFMPFLRYLPTPPWLYKVTNNLKAIDNFIEREIERHRPSFDSKHPRDVIDMVLEKEADNGTTDTGVWSHDNLVRVVFDLFAGGTETTSTSIYWLLLYLIHHPDIQTRCQEEIDHVVGTSRLPSLADRHEMPFLDATLHETLRLCNIAPISAGHATAKETTLSGYTIPKDTLILTNLYAIHMDPSIWENPNEFNPERWLDKNGKLQKNEAFMPFSSGPRTCPGETLTWNELFVFSATLLQRFTFSMVDPEHPPSTIGKFGLTLSPPKFHLLVARR